MNTATKLVAIGIALSASLCLLVANGLRAAAGGADGDEPPKAPAGAPGGAPAEWRRMEGHEDIVWDACFSPDGRWVLSGGGGRVQPFGPGGDFINVAWQPGSDFALRLWDARTGRLEKKFEGHTAGVGCVAFSSDGRLALSGAGDNTLRLWDVQTAKLLRRFDGHTGSVMAAVFSADGKRILSGARDWTVRLWDAKTGAEIRQWTPQRGLRLWDVALSPDGKWAATCGDENAVRLWDVETGKEVRRFDGHTQMAVRVAFSPDGRTLASGGWDNTARLWEVATGKELLTLQGHTGRVEGIAFDPDGRRLLTGSLDKTLRLWDVRTGKVLKVLEGHTAPVARVAVSPDGRLAVSAGWDHTVRVWRLPSPTDAATAWQVFPEAYKPDPKLEAQVRKWVAELGGDDFVRREEAMLTLRTLGDEAVPLLLRLDPEDLSPEQKGRVEQLTAGAVRLSEEQRAKLHDDREFLLDCLEADDVALRRVALGRLREREKGPAEFDVDADPVARHKAVEALRGMPRDR